MDQLFYVQETILARKDGIMVNIVNDIIRMYKKCNIKMHNIVHSFCYTFYRFRRYNMKEINKLKQELLIMKTNNTYN